MTAGGLLLAIRVHLDMRDHGPEALTSIPLHLGGGITQDLLHPKIKGGTAENSLFQLLLLSKVQKAKVAAQAGAGAKPLWTTLEA